MIHRTLSTFVVVFIALLFLAQSAKAQESPGQSDTTFTRKEPIVAVLLSAAWPGLGQLYNGEIDKAKVHALFGLGGVGAMYFGVERIAGIAYDVSPLFFLGLAEFVATQIYSMYDAGTTASRLNARNAAALQLLPTISPEGILGIQMTMRF